MFNDIWSLGITLLNLATGRNPWKSATPNDPTFQAYLRDPFNFLPSVLPISPEFNDILVRMLEVDWRRRTTLREVRYAIERVNNFYSDDVIFKGNMIPKAGMEIASLASTPDALSTQSTSSDIPQEVVDAHVALHSRRRDSASEIAIASHILAEETSYGPQWTKRSCGATWGALDTPVISYSSDSERDHFQMDLFNTNSSDYPGSSLPTTPNSFDTSFDAHLPANSRLPHRSGIGGMGLMINTNIPHPRIYDYNTANDGVIAAYSTHSSLMRTAIEYDPYSSMFFINSPVVYSPEKDKSVNAMPDSAVNAIGEDKEITFPPICTCSSEMPSLSHTDPLPLPSVRDAVDLQFRWSASPSPKLLECQSWGLFPILHDTNVQSSSETYQPTPPFSSLSSSRPFNVLFASRQEYTNTKPPLHTRSSENDPRNSRPTSPSRFSYPILYEPTPKGQSYGASHHAEDPGYPSQYGPPVGRSHITDASTRRRMTLDRRAAGSGCTWTNNVLQRSTEPKQTSEAIGTTWSDVSFEGNRGQIDICPLFSVQSFEPQVNSLSSDVIVTVGIPPEDPTEILFTADSRRPSTPCRSIWTHSFHSAMSLIALDDSSGTFSEYWSLGSCEVSENSSRSARLNFRIGNRGLFLQVSS